jgi:hypothetical protein
MNSTMLSPSKTAGPGRRLSDEDWERFRPSIVQLYRTENKTLKEVMKIMEEENGFAATYYTLLALTSRYGHLADVHLGGNNTSRVLNVGRWEKRSKKLKWIGYWRGRGSARRLTAKRVYLWPGVRSCLKGRSVDTCKERETVSMNRCRNQVLQVSGI